LAVAAGCHNRLSINELGRQVRRPIFMVNPRLRFRRRSHSQGRVHARGRLKSWPMLQKWLTAGLSAAKSSGKTAFSQETERQKSADW